ncbi:MAG: C39 family peptidase, partial [Pelolinea sp.]|nr:C39 family peptidase [Pelolinea sp.]
MQQKRWLVVTSIFLVVTILSYALLLNPVFQARLGWHFNQWTGRIRVWLNPPAQVSFSGSSAVESQMELPSSDAFSEFVEEQSEGEENSEEFAYEFDPLPMEFSIEGGAYFSQHNRWNYCGPANIAMALSYLGWEGTHDDAARGLRTYSKDKSVMPYEMVNFASEQKGIDALTRVGGDLETLKRLIAAGF